VEREIGKKGFHAAETSGKKRQSLWIRRIGALPAAERTKSVFEGREVGRKKKGESYASPAMSLQKGGDQITKGLPAFPAKGNLTRSRYNIDWKKKWGSSGKGGPRGACSPPKGA